ncbi:MAG TPA: YetF domain-containing protein [Oculatellaceae cyanobacterium]|jgi:uncharacterized membrane protein YcaP (DUF421 family)
MDFLFKVDWYKLFIPGSSFAELFIRGTIVYFMLFAILRFLPNRQIGAVGIADLLVVILFANAAENAMSSDYTSITDGALLVSTIIFWSYSLNWLGFKFPAFQRWLNPPPKPLVTQGRMLPENMEEELLTKDELMRLLRQHGVQKLDDVKAAFMEADGSISVIPQDAKIHKAPEKQIL